MLRFLRTHFYKHFRIYLKNFLDLDFVFIWTHLHYIYIYAFSRRFYPKRLTVHSGYTFFLLPVHVFPGNRTHNLLRCWRNALPLSHRNIRQIKCFFLFLYISNLFISIFSDSYIIERKVVNHRKLSINNLSHKPSPTQISPPQKKKKKKKKTGIKENNNNKL